MKTFTHLNFATDALKVQGKYPMWILIFALMMTCFSCQETEFELPTVDRTPVMSMSKEAVELRQSLAGRDAVTFNWSAGSNLGTNSRIEYYLQFDREGNDFSDPVEFEMGSNNYAYTMKVADLNNLVRVGFGATDEEEFKLDVRIKAEIGDEAIATQFSNESNLAVKAYAPVTSTLYLIGDATPNGWDAGAATEMTQNNQNPTKFSTTVFLSSGNFKFITNLGQFLPSYNKGEAEQQLVYRNSDDQPDEQFQIETPGMYKVEVDLEALTITYQIQEGPQFSSIYIVGDASESGWDIDSPEAFTQSESDPFVFTYMGMLKPGEFKLLAGSTGDWCGDWFRPLVDGESIFTTTVAQNSGCDEDNKWRVQESEEGFYKITLNTREVTIKIEKVSLYIIGDAGPNGWDIANPAPMQNNGALFTYEGPLTAGEFKISMFKGDWCGGQWINAANPDQTLSNTDFIFTQGCDGPDNKWKIPEIAAGNYSIQIDLSTSEMAVSAN